MSRLVCRGALVALFVAAFAACAGGPPRDQIAPPPGMETASPGLAPTSPGGDPTTATRGGRPTLEGTPDLAGKTPSGHVELREVEIAFLDAARHSSTKTMLYDRALGYPLGPAASLRA